MTWILTPMISLKKHVSEKDCNIETIPDFRMAMVPSALITGPDMKYSFLRFLNGHLKLSSPR